MPGCWSCVCGEKNAGDEMPRNKRRNRNRHRDQDEHGEENGNGNVAERLDSNGPAERSMEDSLPGIDNHAFTDSTRMEPLRVSDLLRDEETAENAVHRTDRRRPEEPDVVIYSNINQGDNVYQELGESGLLKLRNPQKHGPSPRFENDDEERCNETEQSEGHHEMQPLGSPSSQHPFTEQLNVELFCQQMETTIATSTTSAVKAALSELFEQQFSESLAQIVTQKIDEMFKPELNSLQTKLVEIQDAISSQQQKKSNSPAERDRRIRKMEELKKQAFLSEPSLPVTAPEIPDAHMTWPLLTEATSKDLNGAKLVEATRNKTGSASLLSSKNNSDYRDNICLSVELNATDDKQQTINNIAKVDSCSKQTSGEEQQLDSSDSVTDSVYTKATWLTRDSRLTCIPINIDQSQNGDIKKTMVTNAATTGAAATTTSSSHDNTVKSHRSFLSLSRSGEADPWKTERTADKCSTSRRTASAKTTKESLRNGLKLNGINKTAGKLESVDVATDTGSSVTLSDDSTSCSSPWYVGKLNRIECEKLLQKQELPQNFVIRETGNLPGHFALSVLHKDEIHHFPVGRTLDERYYIGRHYFKSISNVISYYGKCPLFYDEHGAAVTLTNVFNF